jgi:hypothetical protein
LERGDDEGPRRGAKTNLKAPASHKGALWQPARGPCVPKLCDGQVDVLN